MTKLSTVPVQHRCPTFSIGDCNSSFLQVLIEKGADVGSQDNTGRTPLHVASQFNSPQVAQMLLSGNTSSVGGSRDVLGRTPLHLAALHDAGRVAEAILAAFPPEEGVGQVDMRGRTPLHFAAGTNSLSVAGLLVSNGADVDAADTIKGKTNTSSVPFV